MHTYTQQHLAIKLAHSPLFMSKNVHTVKQTRTVSIFISLTCTTFNIEIRNTVTEQCLSASSNGSRSHA